MSETQIFKMGWEEVVGGGRFKGWEGEERGGKGMILSSWNFYLYWGRNHSHRVGGVLEGRGRLDLGEEELLCLLDGGGGGG